jgi:hypothetical protein
LHLSELLIAKCLERSGVYGARILLESDAEGYFADYGFTGAGGGADDYIVAREDGGCGGELPCVEWEGEVGLDLLADGS